MAKKRKSGRLRMMWMGLATTAALAASATILPGLARADVPDCAAPEGSDCLSIDNKTANVHSVRSGDNNNQCITDILPGKVSNVEQVFVPEGNAQIEAFSTNDCGFDTTVPILVTENAGSDGYTHVTIDEL